jgi:transposase InsO family protein
MEPDRIRRRERSYLARLLGVSLRTLERWADARRGPSLRPPGRPAKSASEQRRALRLVRGELLRQGRSSGWRPVERGLCGRVPTREVQHCVRAWKRRWRCRARRAREQRRVHVLVLARDALWAQDATQVGRVDGRAVQAEVVRDAASDATEVPRIGPAAKGAEVRDVLATVAEERGALPLVHAMDNGSPYCEGETRRWLAERKVLVLRSLPHVPQHNAFAERANGELKAESGLASDTVLASTEDARVALEAACMRLNVARCRTSRGGRTARELDAALPRAQDLVNRDTFYETACYNIDRAVQDAPSPHARRLAEREATYETMEQFGLIRRTRGGVPLRAVKCETVL